MNQVKCTTCKLAELIAKSDESVKHKTYHANYLKALSEKGCKFVDFKECTLDSNCKSLISQGSEIGMHCENALSVHSLICYDIKVPPAGKIESTQEEIHIFHIYPDLSRFRGA
jgi:hypothetical protein